MGCHPTFQSSSHRRAESTPERGGVSSTEGGIEGVEAEVEKLRITRVGYNAPVRTRAARGNLDYNRFNSRARVTACTRLFTPSLP